MAIPSIKNVTSGAKLGTTSVRIPSISQVLNPQETTLVEEKIVADDWGLKFQMPTIDLLAEPGKAITAPQITGATTKAPGVLGLLQPFAKAGQKAFNLVAGTTANMLNQLDKFISIVGKDEPLSKKTIAGTEAITGITSQAFQLAFPTVTVGLSAAEEIPVIKYVAKPVNWIFQKLGETGAWVAEKGIENLPNVGQEDKDALKPVAMEVGGLVAQLAGIKVGARVLFGRQLTAKEQILISKANDSPKSLTSPEKVFLGELTSRLRNPSVWDKGILTAFTDKIGQKVQERKINGVKITENEGKKIANEAVQEMGIKEIKPAKVKPSEKAIPIEQKATKGAIPAKKGVIPQLDEQWIKNIYKTGKYTPKEIAEEFKTSESRIKEILSLLPSPPSKEILKGAKPTILEELGKPKEVKPEIPKGKPSKVAISIEAKAIEKGLTEGFKDVAEYTPITIKEQAKMISDLMAKDIKKAKAVATGKEPLPKGMKGAAVLKALEDYAMETKDGKLAWELARSPLVSETSEAGQTLRLIAEREPDSVTRKIKELEKVREKAAEKKMLGKKPKQAKEELKKSAEAKIKEAKPNKYSWTQLITQLTC